MINRIEYSIEPSLTLFETGLTEWERSCANHIKWSCIIWAQGSVVLLQKKSYNLNSATDGTVNVRSIYGYEYRKLMRTVSRTFPEALISLIWREWVRTRCWMPFNKCWHVLHRGQWPLWSIILSGILVPSKSIQNRFHFQTHFHFH